MIALPFPIFSCAVSSIDLEIYLYLKSPHTKEHCFLFHFWNVAKQRRSSGRLCLHRLRRIQVSRLSLFSIFTDHLQKKRKKCLFDFNQSPILQISTQKQFKINDWNGRKLVRNPNPKFPSFFMKIRISAVSLSVFVITFSIEFRYGIVCTWLFLYDRLDLQVFDC